MLLLYYYYHYYFGIYCSEDWRKVTDVLEVNPLLAKVKNCFFLILLPRTKI